MSFVRQSSTPVFAENATTSPLTEPATTVSPLATGPPVKTQFCVGLPDVPASCQIDRVQERAIAISGIDTAVGNRRMLTQVKQSLALANRALPQLLHTDARLERGERRRRMDIVVAAKLGHLTMDRRAASDGGDQCGDENGTKEGHAFLASGLGATPPMSASFISMISRFGAPSGSCRRAST